MTAYDSSSTGDVHTYAMATNINSEQGYASMAIASPSVSRSALLEVIVGTNDNTILIVNESKVEDQVLEGEIPVPVTKMSLDPRQALPASLPQRRRHAHSGTLNVHCEGA